MKKLLIMMMLLPTLAFSMKTIELTSENTINFNQAFDGMFVAKKQVEAIQICSRNKGKDIYIVAYTPGGSIAAGQLFFDTLKALPCKFHTITIFSASMGYQMTQNLGKRYILPSGTLMSHRASVSGLSGEIGGELDQIIANLKENIRDMETIAAGRVGITLEQYKDQIKDELWLTGKKAVKQNHADEIVLAKCDKSLLGTSIEVVRTFFGAFQVEFSDCPLITAPLSFQGMASNKQVEMLKNYITNISERVEATL